MRMDAPDDAADLCTVDHIARRVLPRLAVAACQRCNQERGCLPAHEFVMVIAWRMRAPAA
jgi:hypothetical protein